MEKYKFLTIGNQNIQGGAFKKLSHPELVKIVCNHDIFCIQEACLETNDSHSGIPEILQKLTEQREEKKSFWR